MGASEGRIAQLAEHLRHMQGVGGSSPLPPIKIRRKHIVGMWPSGLGRLPVTQEIAGSNPVVPATSPGKPGLPFMGNAEIAQSVEQTTENRCVGGSIPSFGTKRTSSNRGSFFLPRFQPSQVKEAKTERLRLVNRRQPQGLLWPPEDLDARRGHSRKIGYH